MTTIAILFWAGVFLVFYTYLGYGILLWTLVKIREALRPARRHEVPVEAPEVTLLIAAYNEQEIVAEKMANCRALEYPAGKLRITWITDGSTDRTVELLAAYPDATVLHDARRGGKTAALNRALEHIRTPLVVFTDANTMLNPEAVTEIVRCFEDPQVGCVAGEKRVADAGGAGAAATEGVYWKYESKLKELDYRLYSAVGAAGELFAVRRGLWQTLPEDTLLDDFVCSMLIAAQGYKIAYCKEAYALETPSADMGEEGKRKKRIAARRPAVGLAAAQTAQSVPLRRALVPVRLAPGAALDADARGAGRPAAAQRRPAVVGASDALRRDAGPAVRLLPRGARGPGARTQRTPQPPAVHPLLLYLHEPQRVPRHGLPRNPSGTGRLGKSQKGLKFLITSEK